jgi:hypothetical protein
LTRSLLLLATAWVFIACGRPQAVASAAPSQLPPPDAFQCVMKAFTAMGFQRTMYDQDQLRTSAKRENPKITFSNTQFRRTWDRLDVDVQVGTSGTDLDIVSVTEAEYFRQNGKYLEPIAPSPEVQQAAEELQRRCAGPEASPGDSIPAK